MKKALGLFLVLVLIVGCLAACGKEEKAPENAGEQPTQAATEAPTPADDGGKEETPADTPAEKVTLRVVIKDVSPDDPTYQTWLQKFNEGLDQAGIAANLELVSLQSGTYSENLSLLLNGGDIPDIIYFQGGDEEFGITQHILEDLRPYVESSTYVKALMEDYMKARLENYPYLIYLTSLSTKVPVMRKDIFEECASSSALLADPTADNYYALMKELKDKGYECAWTTAGNLTEIDNTFNQAFGVTATWVKGADGNYVYGAVSDQRLEELKFYAKLFQEGLLDNEYASNNWESKENKFYNNQAAIVSGTQGAVVDIYDANQVSANGESASLIVLPPAKGIGQGYTPVDVSKESRGFAISALSEHKDLAFAVLEYAASPEGRKLDLLGFEGVHYNVVDGKYELTPEKTNWYPVFHGSIAGFDMSSISEKTPFYCDSALSSLEMFTKYATNDNSFVIPEDYMIAWDAATALCTEFTADFIMGKKTEADWAGFVQEWNDNGGKDVTDYANTVLK